MSQSVFDNGGIIGKTQYLFDTKPYIPVVNPESGLTLTRTMASGSSTSFSSTERTQPAVFSCNITFPSTRTDCVLFRAGGTTTACWVGLRDSGTKFRVRAGGGGTVGGSTNSSNLENESTTGTAVLDIFDFPKDGLSHNVTWEFSVSLGRVRLWIDGIFKGESFTSAGGVLGADSTWAGSTTPGYILAGSSASNEPSTVWGGADQGGGLRYYANQTVATNSANFYGNSKNSGIWSLQSIHDSINNKPTVTYIGTTTDVADLITYNTTAFTNLSIGGPGLIVVGIQSETTTAGSSISTCSIGGLIPTTFIDNKMQSTNNSSLVHTALAAVRIASGTTTNIEVGFSATQLRCSVSIWRITNNKSDQPIDIRTSGFSNGSGKSITFKNMVKNAVGVALYTTGSAGSTSPTWTNASMRYDLDIESGGTRISGADFIIPGNSNYLISTNHSTSSGQPIGLTGAVWR